MEHVTLDYSLLLPSLSFALYLSYSTCMMLRLPVSSSGMSRDLAVYGSVMHVPGTELILSKCLANQWMICGAE